MEPIDPRKLGCNRCVDAGPPYRVVKTAGLNLPTFHYLHVDMCIKPNWCDAAVGTTALRLSNTGKWIKGITLGNCSCRQHDQYSVGLLVYHVYGSKGVWNEKFAVLKCCRV